MTRQSVESKDESISAIAAALRAETKINRLRIDFRRRLVPALFLVLPVVPTPSCPPIPFSARPGHAHWLRPPLLTRIRSGLASSRLRPELFLSSPRSHLCTKSPPRVALFKWPGCESVRSTMIWTLLSMLVQHLASCATSGQLRIGLAALPPGQTDPVQPSPAAARKPPASLESPAAAAPALGCIAATGL